MEPKQEDPVTQLLRPHPLSVLNVLRDATGDKERFEITHGIELPSYIPPPKFRDRGLRKHQLATLTDLARYMEPRKMGGTVAFYTDEGVSVIIDEASPLEVEVISCTLERSPSFGRWEAATEQSITQRELLHLLRAERYSINGGGEFDADQLIATFSSLRGELTHDAEEFLDTKSRTSKFTVRRKVAGKRDPEDLDVDDVPTQFSIRLPLLLDDAEPQHRTLMVCLNINGTAGAEPVFSVSLECLQEICDEHIEMRLRDFAAQAGFLCVRGTLLMEPRKTAQLDDAMKHVLEWHRACIAAGAGPATTVLR